jgi:hypothetical protein
MVVGSGKGRGPEQATCVRTAGFKGVHRGEGSLECHESPLV